MPTFLHVGKRQLNRRIRVITITKQESKKEKRVALLNMRAGTIFGSRSELEKIIIMKCYINFFIFIYFLEGFLKKKFER